MIEQRASRIEDLKSPIGLIAGNGTLPIEFAERARALGLDLVCVAHRSETDPDIERFCGAVSWVKIGQLGAIIKALKNGGASQVAFAGGIRRIRLFGGIKLDWAGVGLLSRLKSLRDDAVLRGIAAEIENHGIEVISQTLLLDRCVPRAGVLTSRSLNERERADARLGFEVARSIGRLDIGQTIVSLQGLILAVEAVEGTDAAIQRAGELSKLARKNGKEGGSVVVKLCKPNQDLRFDLPTIGTGTIESMVQAGATGLLVEAGKTLLLDPPAIVKRANEEGIAICAVAREEDI